MCLGFQLKCRSAFCVNLFLQRVVRIFRVVRMCSSSNYQGGNSGRLYSGALEVTLPGIISFPYMLYSCAWAGRLFGFQLLTCRAAGEKAQASHLPRTCCTHALGDGFCLARAFCFAPCDRELMVQAPGGCSTASGHHNYPYLTAGGVFRVGISIFFVG